MEYSIDNNVYIILIHYMGKEKTHTIYTSQKITIKCYNCNWEWESGTLLIYTCPHCGKEGKGEGGV